MGGIMNKLPFDTFSTKKSSNSVRFNPEDYFEHLEGMNLTDEQARDVLSALWDIMVQFVDLGFRVEFDSNEVAPETKPEPGGTKASRKEACRVTDKGERRP